MTDGVVARVVVPAHDAAAFLRDTLDSLAAQTIADRLEIVVVASNCRDDTASVARAYADRLRMRVVETSQGGGNVARNLGADGLDAGTPVLFLDHDDVAEPGWAAALVDGLASADVVLGAYSVEQLNTPETRALRGAVVFTSVPDTYDPSSLTGQGGNCGYRAAAWTALGGLDPDQHFVDDVEILWRAHDRGMTIEYVAGALVQYRLRAEPREYFRQYVNRYSGWAHLRSRHPARVPRRTVGEAARQWAWIAVHLRDARSADPAVKGQWIRAAARSWGSLRGSIRWRTLYP